MAKQGSHRSTSKKPVNKAQSVKKAQTSNSSKKSQSQKGAGVLGTVEIRGFLLNPADPTLVSKGGSGPSSYWITVRAPASDEELDRVYCAVTYEPSGGSRIPLAEGDSLEPLDGTMVTKNNLSAGKYIFRAIADYDDNTHVEGPNGLSVTVP